MPACPGCHLGLQQIEAGWGRTQLAFPNSQGWPGFPTPVQGEQAVPCEVLQGQQKPAFFSFTQPTVSSGLAFFTRK